MSLYFSVASDLQRLRDAVITHAFLTKYNPDQPRVPAGNSDGGQWTADGNVSASADDFSLSYQLAASRGRSAKSLFGAVCC
jgi:hypothetical protein